MIVKAALVGLLYWISMDILVWSGLGNSDYLEK